MSAVPRLVVAAPSSGHGKTAIAVGLLAAARARGVRPAGFKIGPDHVDAAYLGYAAGHPGRNLDPQLVGAGRIGPLFSHGSSGRDFAVVEGTMGLFDGLAGRVDAESTAQIAGLLRAPVLLVVDVATMGQSVAALVHGFRAYDELMWLGGVILNRVNSDRHEEVLREALADLGVPVFGALRRGQLTGGALPPRQTGVVPVLHGSVEASRAVRRLGEAVTAAVDVDRVLALARSAPTLVVEAWSPVPLPPAVPRETAVPQETAVPRESVAPRESVVLWDREPVGTLVEPAGQPAVTRREPGEGQSAPETEFPAPPAPVEAAPVDELAAVRRPLIAIAGGSYGDYGYRETRDLLAAAGAELVTVDPLRECELPAGCVGLVLGGGLPEAYLDEIAANVTFLRSVAVLAAAGAPIVAEAAGLALLARDHAGRPMAGVLPTSTRLGEHLVLGYREATARATSVLAQAGTRVHGYRASLGQASPRAGALAAWLWPGGALEGFVHGGVHASFLTVHWAGVPGVAPRMVTAARRIRPEHFAASPGGSAPGMPPDPGQVAA